MQLLVVMNKMFARNESTQLDYTCVACAVVGCVYLHTAFPWLTLHCSNAFCFFMSAVGLYTLETWSVVLLRVSFPHIFFVFLQFLPHNVDLLSLSSDVI